MRSRWGGELFFLSFADYRDGPDFGYDDPDKREVLEDRIKEAVDLTTGPTRIIRDVVDGVVVLTRMVLDPDGPHQRSFGGNFNHPVSYVMARLRRRTITRQVSDFPLAGGESADRPTSVSVQDEEDEADEGGCVTEIGW